MATINSIDSNIPIEISKGGTNATTMATSNGTIIYDGTSLVTSAVGTAGQVLTSNGASAPTYQSNVKLAKIALTSAQIKSLVASPLTFINAPGANKVIVPLNLSVKFLYGGTNVFVAGASQIIKVFYNTTAGEVPWGSTITNATITGTATVYSVTLATAQVLKAVGVLDNVPLIIGNSTATEISGNAANDNAIYIEAAYFIAELS